MKYLESISFKVRSYGSAHQLIVMRSLYQPSIKTFFSTLAHHGISTIHNSKNMTSTIGLLFELCMNRRGTARRAPTNAHLSTNDLGELYVESKYRHVDETGRQYRLDNLTATGLKGGGYRY